MASQRDITRSLRRIERKVDQGLATFDDALDDLKGLAEDQRTSFDNMSEAQQASEKGQISEARADELEGLRDELEEAVGAIKELLDSIELGRRMIDRADMVAHGGGVVTDGITKRHQSHTSSHS